MWRLLLLLVVLAGIGFESTYVRAIGAQREAVGAKVNVDQVVPLHVTDKHLLNNEVVKEFAKKVPVVIFNYRPGRATEHVQRQDIKDLFLDEEGYQKFSDSFVGWSRAEFDINDISIKEGNVYNSKVTRSFSVGVGKKLWYTTSSLMVMNRALGKSLVEIHDVEVVLAFRNPEEGLGIYVINVY
jgi:hypothetical protein